MARSANSGGMRRVTSAAERRNVGEPRERASSERRMPATARRRTTAAQTERRRMAVQSVHVKPQDTVRRMSAAERFRASAVQQPGRTVRGTDDRRARELKKKMEARAAQAAKSASGESAFSRFTKKIVKAGDIDYTLLFLIILIVAIGLIVMLSASAPAGSSLHDDPYYFFKRQLIFIIIGFAGMFIISRLNLNNFLHWVPRAFIICVVLLILVLIPGIGVEANGARRWLNIPFVQLQPSELMKPVIAMYIAYLVKIGVLDLKKLRSNLVCLGIIGIVALLLMLETHLSGTIVIVGIAGCVMIAGGTPIKPVLITVAALGVLTFVYLQFDPTRMVRVTSLFDPFADAQTTGYQISQSLYAIGSGRLFGLGLGQSVQKYSNLPEPYNDFIFAIICEELGLFGATVIILLFAALFIRAMRIAITAPDVWSSLTCIGIASQLGIQTFLNMGVAVSLIPNTGISLPFFSYGGTSILTLLLEMGILLNVSRKTVKE